MKHLLNLIGCIAVVLAVFGVFLPLLPTTPFLLLASACFVRGSPRLHNWLRTNRVFGAYLRDYEDGRGIPLRGKIVVLVLMWASLGWSMTRVPHVALVLLLAAIGTGVTVYLVRYVPTMRTTRR
ncbi:YbaN family protein [[Empedobacter] haloabium]|uniref:YbaN family protein n=1 Tax=[Empedobacter] haloabium TaxID=592317 RepID=A0ABZ1UIK5_9BURK